MKKLEVEILVTHSPFNVINKFARRKKKYIFILDSFQNTIYVTDHNL